MGNDFCPKFYIVRLPDIFKIKMQNSNKCDIAQVKG